MLEVSGVSGLRVFKGLGFHGLGFLGVRVLGH